MRTYQALALVAGAFSSYVAGLPVDNKAEHPLRVTLSQDKDTVIKATILNTGNEPLGLFKGNELMTDLSDRSLTVYGPDGEVPFEGIDPRWKVQGITADQFIYLMPGESTSTTNDLDKIYDLSKGGEYTIVAEGYFSTGPMNSTEVTKSDYYKSRPLKINLNKQRKTKVHTALAVHRAHLAKRAVLQNDCSGQQRQALEAALSKCAQIAGQAADNAMGNDPNFESFFHSQDQQVKKQVSDRLKAVAQECAASGGGKLKYHCTGAGDPNGASSACQRSGSGGVIAYTIPQMATVWTCDLFYELPADPACGRNDQATTTLHEFTHNDAVFQPGTKDVGYGFQNCQSLSTDQALQNADSFSFYASTSVNQCNGKTSGGGNTGGGSPGGQPGGQPGGNRGPSNPGGPNMPPGGGPPIGMPPSNGPNKPPGNNPGSNPGGSPFPPTQPPSNNPGGSPSPFPPSQPPPNSPGSPGSGSSPGAGGSNNNPFMPPQDPNSGDPNSGNPFFGGPEGGDDNNLGDGSNGGGDDGNNFGPSPFPPEGGDNGGNFFGPGPQGPQDPNSGGGNFFGGPEGGDDNNLGGGNEGDFMPGPPGGFSGDEGASFGGPMMGGGAGPEEFGGEMGFWKD